MNHTKTWNRAVRTLAGAATAIGLGLFTLASAWAQKPEPVTIRWGGTPSVELETPFYVAVAKGYFEEEGIKVGSPMMGPGPRVREALAAGDIDFADVGTLTYIVGRGKGLPQKLVFEYYTREIFSILVPAKLKNEIKTVADLKGRKVLVNALGAASHVAGLSFVRRSGLKDTDVSFVGVGAGGDPATWVATMETGKFDAGITWEPTTTLLIDRNSAFALVDIRDPATHEKLIAKNASSMTLAVSETLIAQRPEVIQRVVRALKKATAFIQKNSPAEVAKATVAGGFKMDEALLARILQPIKGNFSADGRISRSGIEVEVELGLAAKILDKKLRFEDMVDPKFAGSKD
ncbi:MAG: ABC transporter substrate-binding protein [Planctomycetota bacterium]|mgnify:CR=1 FL=1